MSLNKFMHPRNKYRKPPDFKALAIKYPEFRKHAKTKISGKVELNFKNLEAVRILTQTLLKEDFSLDVEIPKSRLVPTLPLRLNYLLWIEDILKLNKNATDTVKGIDIGCGASCVYPLLAAKQFQWHMLATEVDMDSAFTASNNVRKNNLQTMISVRTVPEDKVLVGVLEDKVVYDFCMCNPPFFSSADELEPQNVARSPSRPPPRNAHSGAPHELVAPGGELAFVSRIITDSLALRGQVRVYSTMLGHKTSVGKVKHVLREGGVTHIATTEFCQGRTMRWGVAWTLDPAVVLPQPAAPSHKRPPPFSCTLEVELAPAVQRLKQLMDDLQIVYSVLKNSKELVAMNITAERNTWSNARRRRRQEKLQKLAMSKESRSNEITNERIKANEEENNEGAVTNHDVINETQDKEGAVNISGKETETRHTENSGEGDDVGNKSHAVPNKVDQSELHHSEVGRKGDNTREAKERIKRVREGDEDSDLGNSAASVKRLKVETASTSTETSRNPENCASTEMPTEFLCCSLIVKKSSPGSTIELDWVKGVGGRDAAHQLLHYFKNNLKTDLTQ